MLINPVCLTWATVLAVVIPAIGPSSSGEDPWWCIRADLEEGYAGLDVVPGEMEGTSVTRRASVYEMGQVTELGFWCRCPAG